MKIENVKIKDFKAISDFDFEPDKINIVAGKNRIGKTSLLQAVRFGLTGELDINPVPYGKDKSLVDLKLENGEITRGYVFEDDKFTVKTELNGEDISKKNLNIYLESESQIKPEITKVMSSSEIFENMDKGRLNEFLFDNEIIPATAELDVIVGLCDFGKEAEELFRKTVSNNPSLTIEDLKKCYTQLYDDRRLGKKELAQLKSQSEYKGEIPKLSVDEIEKFIEKNNKFLAEKKLFDEKMKIFNDRMKEIEKYKQEKEELIKKYQDYKSRIKKKPDMTLIPKFKDNIAICDKKIGDLKKTMGVIEGNSKILQTTLERIDTDVCPLSNKLKCATDKTKIKNELESQINNNRLEYKKLYAQVHQYIDKKNDNFSKLERFEEYVREYDDFYQLHQRIVKMKNEKIEVPEMPVQATQSEEDIAKTLAEYKKMRKEADLHAEALSKKALAEEKAKEIKILDEIIKKLSPKGDLYNKILSMVIDPLNEYCDKRSKELNIGFSIKIKAEDGITVTYRPNGKSDFMPMYNASASEKLLITFIIMDMINSLTGFDIMFIDNLDKLDDVSFNNFMELIQKSEVQNMYNHIFMSIVIHGKEEEDILKNYSANFSNLKLIDLKN